MSLYSRSSAPLSVLTAALVSMAVVGCGGGDDAVTPPPPGGGVTPPAAASTTITGAVVKGPVAAAQVCGYTVAANARGTALGSCTTSNTSGNYTLTLPAGSGPLWIEAIGGTYTDETTGAPTSLAAGSALRSIVTANGANVSAMLTPLTSLALNAAVAAVGSSGTLDAAAFSAAATQLLSTFNLDRALNISTTVPTFGSGINSYGTALTAISRMVANGQSLATILAAQPSALAAAYATAATPPPSGVSGQRLRLDFSAVSADFNGSPAVFDLAESASSTFAGDINGVTPGFFTAAPARQVQFTVASPGGAGTAKVVPGNYFVGATSSGLFATVFYNEGLAGWQGTSGTVVVESLVGDIMKFSYVNVRMEPSRRFGSTTSLGSFTFNGGGNARISCLTATACQ